MNRHLATIFRQPVSALALAACFAVAVPSAAGARPCPEPSMQEGEGEGKQELPDKREDIKQKLEQLDEMAGARGEQDTQAKDVIDQLVQDFPGCGPKDRQAIVKQISKCFDERRKEIDGAPDNQLFIAAAAALGEMGPESVVELEKWIGNKKHHKDLTLQRWLILSLGKTKVEAATETLVGLLTSKDDTIIGAAAEALANFDQLELKRRKEIFEELLKTLMSAKAAVDADVNDVRARERYDVVGSPISTALKRLSKHDGASTPEEWQRFWNKSKRDDWDQASE